MYLIPYRAVRKSLLCKRWESEASVLYHQLRGLRQVFQQRASALILHNYYAWHVLPRSSSAEGVQSLHWKWWNDSRYCRCGLQCHSWRHKAERGLFNPNAICTKGLSSVRASSHISSPSLTLRSIKEPIARCWQWTASRQMVICLSRKWNSVWRFVFLNLFPTPRLCGHVVVPSRSCKGYASTSYCKVDSNYALRTSVLSLLRV